MAAGSRRDAFTLARHHYTVVSGCTVLFVAFSAAKDRPVTGHLSSPVWVRVRYGGARDLIGIFREGLVEGKGQASGQIFAYQNPKLDIGERNGNELE